ncbi:MAG TPA: SRPBCC family protein [Microbacteriaceae bacterium]|nr:SRPBCC family protein [Microbacteriaceae bacterium]
MTFEARQISQTIERDPAAVAAFAGDPANLPQWAAGLSAGIRLEAGRWITDSPMGVVEVAFVGPIERGVLDHDVTLPDGTVVHNPLRVLRNDAGSEVVFTLYRLPGVGDEAFEHDAALVAADLQRLRALLEA